MITSANYQLFSIQLTEVIYEPQKLPENEIAAFVQKNLELIREARALQDKYVLTTVRTIIARVKSLNDHAQIVKGLKGCSISFMDLPADIRKMAYLYANLSFREKVVKMRGLQSDLALFFESDRCGAKPPIQFWCHEFYKIKMLLLANLAKDKIVNILCHFGARVEVLDLSPFSLFENNPLSDTDLKKIVAACPNIKEIHSSQADLDYRLLKPLKFLKVFSFWSPKQSVFSLDFLKDLLGLEVLTLANLQSNSFSPIALLTELTNLTLVSTNLDRTECLGSLKKLTRLQLNLSVTSLSELQSLTELIELDLSENKIADISCLSSLVQLKKLKLNNCKHINRADGFDKLTSLHELDVRESNFFQVSELAKLPNLITLFLPEILLKPDVGYEDFKNMILNKKSEIKEKLQHIQNVYFRDEQGKIRHFQYGEIKNNFVDQ